MAVAAPTVAQAPITASEIKSTFGISDIPVGSEIDVNGQKFNVGKDNSLSSADGGDGGEDQGDTKEEWNGPDDARKKEGAGTYPNYYAHKTRSGHAFLMDDSKGAESVTLQHRGGSMVQFHPDGKVAITAQNGQYTLTFGENRVKITGAHDVTVDGAASLRVKGDYNMTVGKNVNMTVAGDYNVVAKNFNQKILGNIDIAAKNITALTEGSVGIKAKGSMALSSKGGFIAGSADDSASIVAKKDLALLADSGEMMVRSSKKMSFESVTGDIAMRTIDGKFSTFAKQGILSFLTTASLETLGSLQVISGALTTVKSAGMVGILAGAEVSIGAVGEVALVAAGGVSIAAAGAVGVAAGGALALTAGGAVGINSSMIAMNGIIEQNSGIIIEAPIVDIPPVPPIPEMPVAPSNPKTDFMNNSAETTQSTGTDILEA